MISHSQVFDDMRQVAESAGEAIFVGMAVHDVIALVPHFPAPDERLVAEQIAVSGGGPAATAAVAFVRLGGTAHFIGAVGEDAVGDEILQGLRAEGVNVTGVIRVPGAQSARSVVLANRGTATRAICIFPGPALQITERSAAARLIRDAEWVHVDHAGWRPLCEFLPRASGVRPRISVDLGNPAPGFTAKGIDLFAPTQKQLVELYGEKPLPELLHAALAEGTKNVVATAGAAGSWALTSQGTSCHVPAFEAEIVSTMGAGDVFHGALLAAVMRGFPLADCLAYANIAAALSCCGLDGRSAIPTHQQVMEKLPLLAAEPEPQG